MNSLQRDHLPYRLALVGLFLGVFVFGLDQTVVSTALPRIAQDLGSLNHYAWVVTSYLVTSAVGLALGGQLADTVSPKHVLMAAVALFLVGSGLSGQAQNMTQLIAFRAAQGLGGGVLYAVSTTAIGLLFGPRQRARVQALFGAVYAAATVVGPLIGALLTTELSWRYVFYVNVPLGIVALYIVYTQMPRLPVVARHRLDIPGIASLTLWTAPLLVTLSWAGTTHPWTSPFVLAGFGVTVMALGSFYALERLREAPLFDVSLLRVPTVLWTDLGQFFVGAAFIGPIVFMPYYLVAATNRSLVDAGLALIPLTGGVVAGTYLTSFFVGFWDKLKGLITGASALMAAALLGLFIALSPSMNQTALFLLLGLLGLALGPICPLQTTAVQNVIARDKMGSATSGNLFLHLMGQAMASAVFGGILVTTLTTQIPALVPSDIRPTPSVVFSVAGSTSADEAQITQTIMSRFRRLDHEISLARRGDAAAYSHVLHNRVLPMADQRQLREGGIQALATVQPTIMVEGRRMARALVRARVLATTAAIRRIIGLAGLFAVASFIFAVLIPGVALDIRREE